MLLARKPLPALLLICLAWLLALPLRAEIPNDPPVAALITIGEPDHGGMAMVTGAAGSVPPNAQVWIKNLQTSQTNRATAAADGSFAAQMFAPPGSWLSVHHGDTAFSSLAPGTMLSTPPAATPGNDFAAVSNIETFDEPPGSIAEDGVRDGGRVWFGGTLADRQWSPGESISLGGDFIIYSLNAGVTDLGGLSVQGAISLQRVFDPDGSQELSNPEFMSHIVTPTGFAHERDGIKDQVRLGNIDFGELSQTSDRTIEASWSADFVVPEYLPDGVYQLVFDYQPFTNRAAWVQGLPNEALFFEDVLAREGSSEPLFAPGLAGLIEVGEVAPRRLSWALLVNDLSNGFRGLVADEDRGRLQLATKNSHPSRQFILPMTQDDGTPRSYRLEPFVPLVSASNRGTMNPPTIPFKYPSGSLEIRVKQPDGTTVDLGSAPFAEAFFQEPASPAEQPFAPGSNFVRQYFGLTTLDKRFDFQFAQYGRHEVIATGTIEDVYGNTYTGGGTYEVFIARTLDLETGVFPNMMFEIGDRLSPTLVVQPGVAADVEIRVQHYPQSDPLQLREVTVTGQANRFGYFQPDQGAPITMDAPGEYRIDYTATWTDPAGALWMGSQSWGGVVATPDSALITHGNRGTDQGEDRAWFSLLGSDSFSAHVTFPYFNGDIMWMQDTVTDPTFTANVPNATLQDTGDEFSDMFYGRILALPQWTFIEPDFVDLYINTGEIPLISTSSTELSPALQRDADDNHWAYAYTGAGRPGVRVREAITEYSSDNNYWRFDDAYNYQLGNGANGDLTNDFKLQYVGAVYRAPDIDFYYYGISGSLWVLVPPEDTGGVRVFPPFQGNGGGPNGGPIMTLKGENIDMFFHPTGVRPGSILEVGQVAAFAGAIAPTLPSEATIMVTSPSGVQTQFTANSNLVGYFYHPENNLVVDEPGVWRATIQVTFTGQMSAGQVEPPYPTGGVLGAGNVGSFEFYVVEPSSSALATGLPASQTVQPAAGAIDIELSAPSSWSDVALDYTVVMPGFLMQQGQQQSLTHVYDSPALSADFPNLDQWDQDGKAGVDTVTLSYLLSGTDGSGKPVFRARQVLLQGEELLAPRQDASGEAGLINRLQESQCQLVNRLRRGGGC